MKWTERPRLTSATRFSEEGQCGLCGLAPGSGAARQEGRAQPPSGDGALSVPGDW